MFKTFPLLTRQWRATGTLRLATLLDHLRSPLFRNGYALIISTGITSALGLVYWAVAANTYATENVGLNSAAISMMIFLSGLGQLNLQEVMIRFIPEAGRSARRLVLGAYAMVLVLSVGAALIFLAGLSLWGPALGFLNETPTMALWFAAAVALWSLFVVQDSVLAGLRQALYLPAKNTIFSIAKIGLLLAFAAALPHTGILLSWTLSVAVVIIPFNVVIFRRLLPRLLENAPPEPSTALTVRGLAKYVAGNYVAALMMNAATALLPLIVTQIAGAEANAHFYIAWTIASALQIFAANMATSLTVEAAHDRTNLAAYRRRALVGILRLLLPAAAVLVVGAPILLRFVGESYVTDGALVLQLLAVSAIPNVYNMLFVAQERVHNRVAGIIAYFVANTVLVLGISLVLLPTMASPGWVVRG